MQHDSNGGSMISDPVRKMTGWHWLMLFLLVCLAWAALYVMSIPQEVRLLSQIYGADFWRSLCVMTPDTVGYFRIFAMWVLMSGAMMAPTALPAFATYEDIGRSTEIRLWVLIAGYLSIWVGYAAIAAGLQIALYFSGFIDRFGQSSSNYLSAALLIGAGLYQFSSIKEGCLAKCRAPLTFFMQHFDEGPFKNGLRLGMVCLGCCWALMLLSFVGGVMNIAFMGLATVLMVTEKMPDIGRYVTKPLGLILMIWGISLLLNS